MLSDFWLDLMVVHEGTIPQRSFQRQFVTKGLYVTGAIASVLTSRLNLPRGAALGIAALGKYSRKDLGYRTAYNTLIINRTSFDGSLRFSFRSPSTFPVFTF